MRMRALALLIALGAATAGCSSDGDSNIERLTGVLTQTYFPDLLGDAEPAPPPPAVTRADLNRFTAAMIGVRGAEGPAAYVVAVADNGGYVTYLDPERQSIVMRGGLVTGTHGLGYNLSAVKTSLDDPVALPRPPGAWAPGVYRVYQYAGTSGSAGFQVAVRCTFANRGVETIEIVELSYTLQRIDETCANQRRTFTNTYWADPATGFIWRSIQWIAPLQDQLTIDVIRPYSGA